MLHRLAFSCVIRDGIARCLGGFVLKLFSGYGTPVHETWFDNLQRVSTSAENAARLLETDANIDVRGLATNPRADTCRAL